MFQRATDGSDVAERDRQSPSCLYRIFALCILSQPQLSQEYGDVDAAQNAAV